MVESRPNTPSSLAPLYEVPGGAASLYETIADCPRCPLARTRTRTVPGSGPLPCDLVFVGEGPGQREDELGLPFVGRSGQFLDELLGSIGRSRQDVYVTNVVKCRPPGNRDPEPVEIGACRDYLDQQLALARPTVVATLGRYSMARWFPGERISDIHGRERQFEGRWVIPMYHPAAALRNGSLRAVMKADFARIPDLLEAAAS
ncbi:MAG: uracil-DNA glycosylase [Dehalococcoidia bacterium]|nr:uracil-DNA glycosylase [Dehalococcoidia bacterium]